MSQANQINWTPIVQDLGQYELQEFAKGEISGESLYRAAIDFGSMESRSQVRRLLRDKGAQQARVLARKALSRRGY